MSNTINLPMLVTVKSFVPMWGANETDDSFVNPGDSLLILTCKTKQLSPHCGVVSTTQEHLFTCILNSGEVKHFVYYSVEDFFNHLQPLSQP